MFTYVKHRYQFHQICLIASLVQVSAPVIIYIEKGQGKLMHWFLMGRCDGSMDWN